MGKEYSIDASIGLAYCLPLFQRYQKSGVFQARIPFTLLGIAGPFEVFLHLISGNVIDCYAVDVTGWRLKIAPELVLRLDSERGPFEWRLSPRLVPALLEERSPALQATQRVTSQSLPVLTRAIPQEESPRSASPPILRDSLIPRIVAPISWNRLRSWTPAHRQKLFIIATLIDGKRTIKAIKAQANLPAHVVEEALRILLALQAVTMPQEAKN